MRTQQQIASNRIRVLAGDAIARDVVGWCIYLLICSMSSHLPTDLNQLRLRDGETSAVCGSARRERKLAGCGPELPNTQLHHPLAASIWTVSCLTSLRVIASICPPAPRLPHNDLGLEDDDGLRLCPAGSRVGSAPRGNLAPSPTRLNILEANRGADIARSSKLLFGIRTLGVAVAPGRIALFVGSLPSRCLVSAHRHHHRDHRRNLHRHLGPRFGNRQAATHSVARMGRPDRARGTGGFQE